MLDLPAPEEPLPPNRPAAIRWFWATYWAWFLLWLPWMLVRQAGLLAARTVAVLRSWNRTDDLLGGDLSLIHLSGIRGLLTTAIFGERFVALRYRDVLVDPGPEFGLRRLRRVLRDGSHSIRAIVVTHAHEEHIGNAPPLAREHDVPIHGSTVSLEALRTPEALSFARRSLMGQPRRAIDVPTRELEAELVTPEVRLRVLDSAGHCAGHVSLFDGEHGILFAGDSFLHTTFSAPNRDVSSLDWIETLERYLALDVRTMIGTHGDVLTVDPAIPAIPFVVRRDDPREQLEDKLRFLTWCRDLVAAGEERGLPYSVIEACLFPWRRSWVRRGWFGDEAARLLSTGEFSRTHLVRSLSRTPGRVPERFRALARWKRRLTGDPRT